MTRFVPLAAFEHDGQAVIAVDNDASVRLCNRAAHRLLGLPNAGSATVRCWKAVSFRTLDGRAFCRPICPVQEAARDGRSGAQHWVVPASGSRAGRPVEMVSFFVPSPGADRSAVLHFLRPASLASLPNGTARSFDLEAVRHISSREGEVLHLLAEGRSTIEIARSLGISTNTVRNHLRNVFRKLGVHRRIEALLAFGRNVDEASEKESA